MLRYLLITGFVLSLVHPLNAQSLRTKVDEVIAIADRLITEESNFKTAERYARAAFDHVISFAPDTEPDLFIDTAAALRLIEQVSESGDDAVRIYGYLKKNTKLARAIAFTVSTQDTLPRVYALLDAMQRKHGDRLNDYANLVAAICVVHDKMLTIRVNENRVKAPDPLALLDYFMRNEKQMLFGIKNVPPELLVHVVNCTSPIDQMQWALSRYRGNTRIGRTFFDIQYDWDHLRNGTPKAVTQQGYSLPNIAKLGGVCADQAYFASMVGKSIGVPTAVAAGQSGTSGHAWVGYLEARGKRGSWNFNVGRYRAYQGVRGMTLDPQTRKKIPDSYVSLTAEYIDTDRKDRYAAIAWTDAVLRMIQIAERGRRLPTQSPVPGVTQQRTVSASDRLDLLKLALSKSPGNALAWLTVAYSASRGELSLADKRTWARELERLCGKRYPDFSLDILIPMIAGEVNVDRQDDLWEVAFNMFTDRSDLAAEVRMHQGMMWAKAGNFKRAGKCYEDITTRFANAGPFVISALLQTEDLLREMNQSDKVLRLYAQTWARISKPQDINPAFKRYSNWYKVGTLYVDRLRKAGLTEQANRTTTLIDKTIGE